MGGGALCCLPNDPRRLLPIGASNLNVFIDFSQSPHSVKYVLHIVVRSVMLVLRSVSHSGQGDPLPFAIELRT